MPDRWTLGINKEELGELTGDGRSRVPMLHAMMQAAVWPNDPPVYYRPVVKPKKQLIEEMGKELTDLCWTCRRPVKGKDGNFEECGECKTCKLMNEIR